MEVLDYRKLENILKSNKVTEWCQGFACDFLVGSLLILIEGRWLIVLYSILDHQSSRLLNHINMNK